MELDRALDTLRARRTEWARLAIPAKVALLARVRDAVFAVADSWVRAAASAKSLDADSPLTAEDWLGGPWALLFAVNRYIETLQDVELGRPPRLPDGAFRRRPDGRLAVRVFPMTWQDRLLLGGVSAEVWMEEGVTRDSLSDTMAVFYRERDPVGAVSLVLGAGNIAAIGPLDVLTKLFVEGHVCMLKLNPVNDYLGPLILRAFAPFIDAGYVQLAYGGADVGERLCLDARIDEIHMTGSEATFDAILFGTGAEGAERKRRNEPRLQKRLTGELGNVTPVIIVPGVWSDADLRFHAENVVTQKLLNAGFNCIAAQVLILPKDWPQVETFLEYVRAAFRAAADRQAYYPGAAARIRCLADRHASSQVWDYGDGVRALVANIDPDKPHELFTQECFGPLLAETRLPGRDARTYLEAAVRFANERLHGTLGANVILHPHTERELGPALDELVARLRYGCVAINIWVAAGFLMAVGTWGAFPGHVPRDIQSGVGQVHNARMFSRAERTIVRGAFQPFPRGVLRRNFSLLPKPPWFVTNRRAHEVTRRLVAFEATRKLRLLPGILTNALRG